MKKKIKKLTKEQQEIAAMKDALENAHQKERNALSSKDYLQQKYDKLESEKKLLQIDYSEGSNRIARVANEIHIIADTLYVASKGEGDLDRAVGAAQGRLDGLLSTCMGRFVNRSVKPTEYRAQNKMRNDYHPFDECSPRSF